MAFARLQSGMGEHAHLLLSLKPVMPIAAAVKIVKAGSSGWINDLLRADFKWQEGYAAFTVSLSLLDSVKRYVANQEQHHRKIDFAAEWRLLLEKHGILLPARSLFGSKFQSSGSKPDSIMFSHGNPPFRFAAWWAIFIRPAQTRDSECGDVPV